ncbi:EPIDERMAL PATTERNING FACTOR-like protein 4 [Aristolochia californica]|uniref:EPIDERMAL PATTERNING FACTOR-like protein 4 n=1 Tax=Aristolochia californica TaxID=171875 RepID=UPI0035D67DDD
MDLKGWRPRFKPKRPCFYCFSICLFSLCALVNTFSTRSLCFGIRGSTGRWNDCYTKGTAAEVTEKVAVGGEAESFSDPIRRYLSGPGSSPPRCTSKCGKCSPCKPVHVPVPPGTPVTTEYYPEAWRCKCGNKLYMP